MNLFTKQKQSHRCRKYTYGYQGGKSGGGINWEIGTDIYTLLYIKQITNKDQLYSTGNSTQYFIITYMEKECVKEQDTFGAATMENSMEVPSKTKTRTTI